MNSLRMIALKNLRYQSFKRFQSSSTAALAYKALHRNSRRPPLPVFDAPGWSADSAVSSILYETPLPSKQPPKQHIFNCLVQNEPGVLALISSTLAARGFNIDSLVVCNTDVKDLSRMTIILEGQDAIIEQARRQIEDLVPVFAVLDYSNTEIIKRELLLARVSLLGPEYFQDLVHHHMLDSSLDLLNENIDPESDSKSDPNDITQSKYHPKNLPLSEVLRLKNHYLTALDNLTRQFGGRIVDISDRNCIIELSAKPSRVTSFLKLIRNFGVLEVARSGMMALPRTPLDDLTADQSSLLEKDSTDVVDLTQLPPG
ncbi:acetolactate synthase regulatory subunit [Ascoidea rubescens DSM 1968]|uniref:Acetolactate synthase n=1 Tax=Ascoidea rubescens DSM 1968 TaxID=1344418 RepID=A0A1D2VK93_9ASCO|nr:acetolactate synthase [Ascoidea rubescens DSM 1968]ODV61937.1 acetolactate synthase [Ascoidea rubescens DSM 1968]